MRPLVSVVMPSYNHDQFLREAIDSALSQDYEPLELLVMDGGSSDGTLDILRSYGCASSSTPRRPASGEPGRAAAEPRDAEGGLL